MQRFNLISITCAPIKPGARSSKVDIRAAAGRIGHGGFSCGDDKAAVGVHGRAGIYVDALGLICGSRPIPAIAPQRPGADPEACAAYASTATQKAKLNAERNCGGTGPRWSTNRNDHYSWCLGQNGNMSGANAEAAAREKQIASCQSGGSTVQSSGKVESGINRPGGDYKDFVMEPSIAGFAPCQSACTSNSQCKAWTFVVAGVQGPKPHCWLKNTIPKPINDKCCVSGVK